jgi:wyosine [tRNA(Phe)-imidazoG37] synthetase (radical SAM superfamily)
LNVFQWLRYDPWLAQVVVTRWRKLKCGYCTDYDRTSDPAPYDKLALRLTELRAWAVCLTSGEPTTHPRLPDHVAEMKRLGFKQRMLITNGWRLTPALIDALNRTVRACQERDAVVGWTLTGSNQADVGSISLRSGTW